MKKATDTVLVRRLLATAVDSGQDIRSEMLSVMEEMGVPVEKHLHEVAPSQHGLGVMFGALSKPLITYEQYKYAVHNVAHAYGVSTFMPK